MDAQNPNKRAVELIDWLSVTYSPESLAQWFAPIEGPGLMRTRLIPLTRDTSRWAREKARYGYTHGWKSDNGTIVYAHLTMHGTDCEVGRLGVHVVYPGGALNGLKDHLALLGMHLARGARVRRIDLARDAFYFDIDLEAMLDELRAGDAQTRARSYRLITGTTGQTLYVGSRTSPMLWRGYDKGAQTGAMPAGTWYRFELEVKGDKAHGVAQWIHETGEFSAAEALTTFYQSDCGEYALAMQGTGEYGVIPSDRKVSDTRQWLCDVIAKTVARQVVADEEFMDRFLAAIAEHVTAESDILTIDIKHFV